MAEILHRTGTGTGTPRVAELLEERARLRAWLERLENGTADANPRVVERVRRDYEQRMRAILGELTGYGEELRRERAALETALREAEERTIVAQEALEEATLRHRIGELDELSWAARRSELEEAVAAAVAERDGARAEGQRMDEVLALVEGIGEEAAPEAPGSSPPTPVPLEADPHPGEEGIGFLAALDRALDEDEPDTRPPPGVRCPDCGYVNDAEAAFCGVCGAALEE